MCLVFIEVFINFTEGLNGCLTWPMAMKQQFSLLLLCIP